MCREYRRKGKHTASASMTHVGFDDGSAEPPVSQPPVPIAATAPAESAVESGSTSNERNSVVALSDSLNGAVLADTGARASGGAPPITADGTIGPADDVHIKSAEQAHACGGVVASGGKNADPSQPGGGRVQLECPELDPINAPSSLRHSQLTATVAGYRAAAIAHGIPFRCVD